MLTITPSETTVEEATVAVEPELVVDVTDAPHDIGPMIKSDSLWARMVWWVTHFA